MRDFFSKKIKILLLVSISIISGDAFSKENFRMSTLGPGTSPYMVMTTFANIINKNLPEYSIVVNATGAATRHTLDTAKRKTDFYMSAPSLQYLMSNQIGMYKNIKNAKELSSNLRALFNFPMGLYHGVVYADSDIKSMSDIKGKRLFVGPPGSASRYTVTKMIEAITGYKGGVDYTIVKLGWDAAAQSFQDKNIDVYFNPTNAPSPVISQFALTEKVRFLGIPKNSLHDKKIEALTQRPGFHIAILKPGLYGENQVNTDDVYTLSSTVGIGTNKDIPENVVYKMTKTFWEHIKTEYSSSPWLRDVSLKKALFDLNIPLHKGAERYYREIGLIK